MKTKQRAVQLNYMAQYDRIRISLTRIGTILKLLIDCGARSRFLTSATNRLNKIHVRISKRIVHFAVDSAG